MPTRSASATAVREKLPEGHPPGDRQGQRFPAAELRAARAKGAALVARARGRRNVPKKRTLSAVDDDSPIFLSRLRARDPEAFTKLAADFRDRVYNLGLRITRSPDDAEDILQETLLSTFLNIGSFEGRSKLSTWIHVIACNAALSRKRRRSSGDLPYNEEEPRAGGLPTELFRNRDARFQTDTSDPVLLRELQERLDEAIDALPPVYREMFILKELQFAQIKEIAAAFGVRPGAVKTRIHRARLMLRAHLSDYRRSGI